ncbi:sulfotransferase [Mesorhizobium sp. B2-3-4]|uniref:tetratricopeptide repeat-containing sulfotransferase family protein n=1 Tax=Mesorhizobium sp. B2-3-4 TaxID=2589959 RepID=UPI001125EE6D|nr:sulfotransferase [Mesorhizobium sp. B2-3-4]TPM38466.1 tetratricopeptide repeat protein [Mesorhizobium sp. B2-3-4]
MASAKKRAKSRQAALEPATLAKFLEQATQLHGEGRFDEAARLYLHVEKCNPEALAASYFLALIDIETGWLDRALERLRLVTRQDPSSFDAVFALGHTFGELGQWPQAVNAYQRARTIKPQSTTARFALARALEVVGQLDDAIALFRDLANFAPVRLNALMSAAQLKPSEITSAESEEMAAVARDTSTPVAGRIGLLFALAGVLETSSRYEGAFATYLEANRLRRERLIEDAGHPPELVIASPGSRPKFNTPQQAAAQHAQMIARAKQIFTPDLIARYSGKGHDSPAPIFILGMPRSGSTLLEQILSSHGKVEGLGEGVALWRTISGRFPLVAEAGAEDDPEFFRKLAEDYLARQRAFGWRKAPFVVDKMLGNYMSIGMIHLMFPKATILHSVRDPVDTCLACFRQLFRTGNETTYDLSDIGEHYVRYREMMAHWETVLPGRFVNVVHEQLITDPDSKIRWLVEDACKLKWDENCIRFHQTKRAVRTASIAQVRQPIFNTSLQRWRKYASHLGPLMEALGPYAPR